ncbi:mechanosensitive ion channel family protein [Rhizobium hidalgonense]|uniref:Mechanosensitive ion channel family protein n=1 Tax=Rhizobium hidalgonense TaxID=1538159 RepID=A0A2A6KJ05_9HYPH|nr:mechanosensitive ion channel family protein [Rhizobium hidalgonense]EJC77730.1 small-conductance mechanosensitive channel [Rhizobium leguminosarum bv. trifolii WSM2012]MDR9775213.1 mechanosensitive ion channel family protein [Rhizobium hidalgonense]MDR9805873.1 mechanosensitive ion channel family protein [Rhizobium hidalgonense]MDR9811807.1 mechanosensitive ion channel family protein [Rhizobium hidalgonense]MDR9819955.1 mechanosensitive ion channel family protein [Rhizobium hidalgonense]
MERSGTGVLKAAMSGILALVVLLGVASPSIAQTSPAQLPTAAAPPAQVREMMQLMQTPEVKQWMATQMATTPAGASAGADQMSVLSGLLQHARRHVSMVSDAAMTLPSQVGNASSLFFGEIAANGWPRMVAQFLAIFLVGAIVESIARYAFRRRRRRLAAMAGMHLAPRVIPALIFAAATVLALLSLGWPPLSQSIAIVCVVALVVQRFTICLGGVLVDLIGLARTEEERQGITAPTMPGRAVALFWYRRCATFVIYFMLGWAAIQSMEPLAYSPSARLLVGYILGIGLLLIAIEAVWSRPHKDEKRGHGISWALTVYFLLLWSLWVAGFNWLLWLGIYVLLLPRVLAVSTLAVKSLQQTEASFLATRRIATVLLDRGVRALIIAVAAVWLGRMLGVGADTMAAGDTMVDKIARGVIGGIVILLAADLLWHVVRAFIDGKLLDSPLDGGATDEEKAKRARIQTLLPIFRNILAVVIAVIAVLMVLSGLGIEIGPLIAGAGVVGVAVGFGAQTIVKDVISGMFYLWDDAFRIGEYIESGSHKGVVEAFSLRSVKLRHHRGPLTTVPFGELGAVKNLNRDWTIDKISLNVKYDTDLVKAKKVIKQIGQTLLDNPEFGPHIIETLKMKGVEQFGEFAIEIRLSMMTKPGEQFVIRRNALAMIRNAFKENGIEFAVPTVQVAGDRDAEVEAAVARYAAHARANGEPAA